MDLWLASYVPPYNIKGDYGFFHVYAFTMTLGIIVSILACYIKMRAKKMPIEPLIWSIFFIIPASLFGGSFFGKLNAIAIGVNADYGSFWSCFEFWKAGMSIHGGVLFGTIVGIIFFGFVSRKYNISMFAYGDAIIPNILLGQVIGRWGNFFNHELLGDPVSYQSLSWLPAFIQDNCWKWIGGMPEMDVAGNIIYRAPIFLYEGIGNFLAWLIITFCLPHAGRLWQSKVYKKYNYSFWARLKYLFMSKKMERPISYKQVWSLEYFLTQPTLISQINSEKIDNKFDKSKALLKIYNPNKSLITYAGVEMGAYFLLWNIVRFFIELQRSDPADWFIMNNWTADWIVIWMIALIGLGLALVAQFVAPRFLRDVGFQYEKEYYDMRLVENWTLNNVFKNEVIVGKNNNQTNVNDLIKLEVKKIIGLNDFNFNDYFELKNNPSSTRTLVFSGVIVPTQKTKTEFKIKTNLPINFDYRINLSKAIKNKLIVIITDANDKTKIVKQIQNALENNYANLTTKMKIKKILLKNFKAVDDKETIFNLKLINYFEWDKLSIDANNKQVVISKFLLKENNYFTLKHSLHFKQVLKVN